MNKPKNHDSARLRFERTYGAEACVFCLRHGRGRDHQRGCPEAPPLTKEELLELAELVGDGWAAKNAKAAGAGA
jgi:hypothetical protein